MEMLTPERLITWEESKRFITEHSKQQNIRYGIKKLDFHLENYYSNRPDGDILKVYTRGEMYGKPKQCRYNHVKPQSGRIELLKQTIKGHGTLYNDEKTLVSAYIEYISDRPKTSKLFIGRTPGKVCPEKDREIILTLHGHKCVMCGSTENLQVHHIEPLYVSGNTDIENQAPLCKICHCKAHEDMGDVVNVRENAKVGREKS